MLKLKKKIFTKFLIVICFTNVISQNNNWSPFKPLFNDNDIDVEVSTKVIESSNKSEIFLKYRCSGKPKTKKEYINFSFNYINSDNKTKFCVISFDISQYNIPFVQKDSWSEKFNNQTLMPDDVKSSISNFYNIKLSNNYINKSGILSNAPYEHIYEFNDGLALVERNALYGFINENGEEVIPCKYLEAASFSDGFAYVAIGDLEITEKNIWKKNLKFGIINKSGIISTEFKFKAIRNLEKGMATALDMNTGNWGCIDVNGKWLIAPIYCSISEFDNFNLAKVGLADGYFSNKYGYINRNGNIVIDIKYDNLENVSKNRIKASNYKDNTCGIFDSNGKLIIPFNKYNEIDYFSEGLARFTKDGKCGFIDENGIEIIKPQFEYTHSFKNNIALARKNGKIGWIDRKGNFFIKNIYDIASDFRNKNAIISRNGYWGVVNNSGKEILPPIYDAIKKDTLGFVTEKDGKIFYFDLNGKVFKPDNDFGMDYFDLNETFYDENILELTNGYDFTLNYLEKFETGITLKDSAELWSLASSKKDKFMINNSNGVFIVNGGKIACDYIYDSIKSIVAYSDCHHYKIDIYRNNDHILVGYRKNYADLIFPPIDSLNRKAFVIHTEYSLIENRPQFLSFSENNYYLRVKKDNKMGLIKIQNNKIIEVLSPEFEDCGFAFNENFGKNDLGIIKKNGFWAFLNLNTGKILTNFKYQNIGVFFNHCYNRTTKTLIAFKFNDKWGFLNHNLNEVISNEFEDVVAVYDEQNGGVGVKKNGKWGFINENGQYNIPPIFDQVNYLSRYVGLQIKLKKMIKSINKSSVIIGY